MSTLEELKKEAEMLVHPNEWSRILNILDRAYALGVKKAIDEKVDKYVWKKSEKTCGCRGLDPKALHVPFSEECRLTVKKQTMKTNLELAKEWLGKVKSPEEEQRMRSEDRFCHGMLFAFASHLDSLGVESKEKAVECKHDWRNLWKEGGDSDPLREQCSICLIGRETNPYRELDYPKRYMSREEVEKYGKIKLESLPVKAPEIVWKNTEIKCTPETSHYNITALNQNIISIGKLLERAFNNSQHE